jgi:hypothetical protein
VTQPLAEIGCYVFPVDVVDKFLKENGVPTAGEIHQVPLAKTAEIFGADSMLFVALTQYGSKFLVLSSTTMVAAEAKLVAAAVTQAINSKPDPGHQHCTVARPGLIIPQV